MRILYAEDDIKMNTLVEESLKSEGYTIDAVFDGDQAVRFANLYKYDIIILDLMMPNLSGTDAMMKIKAIDKNIPILALSALSETKTKIENLDGGFDDYLTKPFKLEELKARIRALIRRSTTNETVLTARNLKIIPSEKKVLFKNQEMILTAKEYSILEYLMRNKTIFKNESEIVENIWEHDKEIGSNIIAAHIKNIKKKFSNIDNSELFIESERGKGYRIIS